MELSLNKIVSKIPPFRRGGLLRPAELGERSGRGIYALLILIAPLGTRYIFSYGLIKGVAVESGTVSLFVSQILVLIFFSVVFFKVFAYQKNSSKNTTEKNIKNVFGLASDVELVFVVSGLIQALLGIYQFAVQKVFASKFLGMSVQDVLMKGASVVDIGSGRILRAYGTFSHPNIFGFYVALVLIFVIYLYFKKDVCHCEEDRSLTKQSSTTFTMLKIATSLRLRAALLAMTVVILSIALIFSFSRTAIIGFVIGLIALFIFSKHRKRFFMPIILIIMGFSIAGLVSRQAISARVFANSRLETKSINERVIFAKDAIVLFKLHPIIGVGLGNMPQATFKELDSNRNAWDYGYAHNVFLMALAETGLVGATLLLAGLIFWLRFLIKQYKTKADNFVILLGMSTLIFFAIILDHYLWSYWPPILCAILGIFLVLDITNKNQLNSSS